MSKPRIFISSTYYDLKSVRDDLDRFISGLGYESVRHELGHISYGRDERPETYAYREIEYCDILVSIVGGRFGSGAAGSDYSVSQKELKNAYELGKQVYIFIDRSVQSEYKYYLANKDVPGIKYTAVSDPKVYSFLEEIHALPKGNPIFTFDTSGDITDILREQWAGMFQRLLLQESNRSQTSLTQELQRSLQTVDQLVKFLTDEKTKGDKAIQEILFANHPVFEAIRALTKNKYRLYFSNLFELNEWLKAARGFSQVDETVLDSPNYFEWVRTYTGKSKTEQQVLYVSKDLFGEDDRLKSISPTEWKDEWVKFERKEIDYSTLPDEEFPF